MYLKHAEVVGLHTVVENQPNWEEQNRVEQSSAEQSGVELVPYKWQKCQLALEWQWKNFNCGIYVMVLPLGRCGPSSLHHMNCRSAVKQAKRIALTRVKTVGMPRATGLEPSKSLFWAGEASSFSLGNAHRILSQVKMIKASLQSTKMGCVCCYPFQQK